MANFDLNSIGRLLSGGGLAAIAKRTKVKQADVAKVLSAGIPALLSGMADNVSNAAGEASLSRALQDHKLVTAANAADFMKQVDLKDSKKILGHVFGDKQNALIERISAEAGVNKAKTTTILALAAPLLLSLLSNQSGGSGLSGLLGGLLGGSGNQNNNQSGGLLGNLLGGNTLTTALGVGLLASLLGGSGSNNNNNNQNNQAQEQESSGGLFSSLLNLLH